MHVLMDIHILGRGFSRPYSRRGIYRYTENLVRALAVREDVELTFCSLDSWSSVNLCHEYLNSNPDLPQRNITQPGNKFMTGISGKLAHMDHDIKHRNQDARSIGKKFSREVLRTLLKAQTFYRGSVFSPQWLPEADVYHNPHLLYRAPEIKPPICTRRFTTVHDIIPIKMPEFGSKAATAKFRKRLDALTRDDWILTVSQFSADDLCNYADNIDPQKVLAVPLAAAPHFQPCTDRQFTRDTLRKYDIPEQGEYILSLSALEPRKNLELTVFGFQNLILQEGLDSLFLVLVGQEKPGFRSYLREILKSSEVQNRIKFTGYVPDEDLSHIYSAAAAFLFPSFYEGFGLPPLEAMQCGTPVIASNRSSIPEVLGDAGILIDPESVDELSQAVLRVLEDSELRQELSQKSLARAAEFSWAKHAETTAAGYRKALEQ